MIQANTSVHRSPHSHMFLEHSLILAGTFGMCIALILALLQTEGQFSWDIDGGIGTQDHPYMIDTCEQLQNISKYPVAIYALEHDIDCSPSITWDHGTGFAPIAYYGNGFAGSFDGRRHTVHALTIHRPELNDVGVFGKITSTAHIANVTVDVDIEGNDNVGGLVGRSSGGLIDHVLVTGKVSGHQSIGGVTGVNQGTIQSVTGSTIVTGQSWVGGITGFNYEHSKINDVSVAGSIRANNYVGGVAGVNRGAAIKSCSVSAVISANQHAGTFVGWMIGGNVDPSLIGHCRFNGTIQGSETGALFGRMGLADEN